MYSEDETRPYGWYWVKVGAAPWEPSTLSSDGHPNLVKNGKTYELGPRIPTPDEKWQNVPTNMTLEMLSVSGHENSYDAAGAWQDMLAAAPTP